MRRKRKAKFRVSVRNAGTAAARSIVLKVTRSKRTLASRNLGRLEKGRTRAVQVPLAFSRRGRARLTFTVTSANAGRKSAAKTIRVR